ncbi:hypothetical protein M8494_12800 [Serratia ureilytica]
MSDGSPAAECVRGQRLRPVAKAPARAANPVISVNSRVSALGGDTRVVQAGEPDIAGQRRQRLLPERRCAAGNPLTR